MLQVCPCMTAKPGSAELFLKDATNGIFHQNINFMLSYKISLFELN